MRPLVLNNAYAKELVVNTLTLDALFQTDYIQPKTGY